eukprot:m.27274 g.27274  ORF g.27274 m.27274 type:complete len:133 (+) comp29897_c0_seq1:204-602(+)
MTFPNTKKLGLSCWPSYRYSEVEEILNDNVFVESVHDVKAIALSSTSIHFTAVISFDWRRMAISALEENFSDLEELVTKVKMLQTEEDIATFLFNGNKQYLHTVKRELGRIEDRIKESHPECCFVDLLLSRN